MDDVNDERMVLYSRDLQKQLDFPFFRAMPQKYIKPPNHHCINYSILYKDENKTKKKLNYFQFCFNIYKSILVSFAIDRMVVGAY